MTNSADPDQLACWRATGAPHAQNDLNLRILHMLVGIFSLDEMNSEYRHWTAWVTYVCCMLLGQPVGLGQVNPFIPECLQ